MPENDSTHSLADFDFEERGTFLPSVSLVTRNRRKQRSRILFPLLVTTVMAIETNVALREAGIEASMNLWRPRHVTVAQKERRRRKLMP